MQRYICFCISKIEVILHFLPAVYLLSLKFSFTLQYCLIVRNFINNFEKHERTINNTHPLDIIIKLNFK